MLARFFFGLSAAVLASIHLTVGVGGASAEDANTPQVFAEAWFWRTQPSSLIGARLEPPDPEGYLPVAANGGRWEKISLIRLEPIGGSISAATLRVHAPGDPSELNRPNAAIVACLVGSEWERVEGGSWDLLPEISCSTKTEARLSAAGPDGFLEVDLAPFLSTWRDVANHGLALVPAFAPEGGAPSATFQLNLRGDSLGGVAVEAAHGGSNTDEPLFESPAQDDSGDVEEPVAQSPPLTFSQFASGAVQPVRGAVSALRDGGDAVRRSVPGVLSVPLMPFDRTVEAAAVAGLLAMLLPAAGAVFAFAKSRGSRQRLAGMLVAALALVVGAFTWDGVASQRALWAQLSYLVSGGVTAAVLLIIAVSLVIAAAAPTLVSVLRHPGAPAGVPEALARRPHG